MCPLLTDIKPQRHIIPGTLELYKYHGANRRLPLLGGFPYHVVVSTYGTVAADFSRGGGVLSCYHWHRLVLDEGICTPMEVSSYRSLMRNPPAHLVRNWSTQQFNAVAAISAAHRWCMTGTPVQNSLDDLSSLTRFLRVPRLEDPSTFQKHISGRRTAAGIRRPNYTNLKLLLGFICLRRSTFAILSSLGVTFVEHRPQFSAAERKAYDELALSFERSIKAAVNSRSSRKSSKSILTAMLRLRIFCNTGPIPGNLDDDVEDNFRDDELISLQIQSGEAVCSRCNTEIATPDLESESQRNKGSRRLLKCLACSQQDVQDVNTAKPASDPTIDGDPMEGVEMENPATLVPASDASKQGEKSGTYPSKLMALLVDIKEHYAKDKR